MVKGTRMSPPTDAPAAVMPMAVARLRWNHFETMTAPVVMEPADMATAMTMPKMKMK